MADDYCSIDLVKDRMLIDTGDSSFDGPLGVAITEASRLVDIFLKPYVTVPLTTIAAQVEAITADFAASIFKRRMMPAEVGIRGALQPDQINEITAEGWFAQGIKKIEQYIKSFYTLAQTIGNTAHNPDMYITLFERGIITGKEARAFINTESAIASKRIEELCRTETLYRTRELTDTIIEDVTKSLGETLTKSQVDTITQTISKTLTDVLTQTKTITSIEDLTKTLVDTLTQNITKVLGETITREETDTLTKTIGQTLTKNQEDIEDLTRTENIIIDKTLTTDETHTRYVTNKQKSFAFVSGDPDTEGYKEQED